LPRATPPVFGARARFGGRLGTSESSEGDDVGVASQLNPRTRAAGRPGEAMGGSPGGRASTRRSGASCISASWCRMASSPARTPAPSCFATVPRPRAPTSLRSPRASKSACVAGYATRIGSCAAALFSTSALQKTARTKRPNFRRSKRACSCPSSEMPFCASRGTARPYRSWTIAFALRARARGSRKRRASMSTQASRCVRAIAKDSNACARRDGGDLARYEEHKLQGGH
jgi:hypothetical protein